MKLIADATSNAHPVVESQPLSTGSDYAVNTNEPSTIVLKHRDALGRVSEVSETSWPQHGWYLDPDDAKLRKLRRVQDATSLHSKIPWAIRAAALAYRSEGKGELKLQPAYFAAVCLAIPVFVS